jgi:hypothetical protein
VITLSQVDQVLETATLRLRTLVHIAFPEGDDRGSLLEEKLSHEVYGLAVNMFGLKDQEDASSRAPDLGVKEVEFSEEHLTSQVSHICGRVLTYIELAVPAQQQCDAFKSLAGDIVWDIAKGIRKLGK